MTYKFIPSRIMTGINFILTGMLKQKKEILILSLSLSSLLSPGQNFVKVTDEPFVEEGRSFGVNWVDFNNDGLMDLFAVNPSGSNYLYMNMGEADFVKVTDCPIIQNSSSFTSGSCWGDYDNDGIIDLFLAAQGGSDVLYRGTGNGNFLKLPDEPLGTDGGGAYNAAWADFDNDSYLDLYVATNAFSVTGKDDFFYHNNCDGTFSRIKIDMLGDEDSDNTGIGWCDFNNDGHTDLLVPAWNKNNLFYRNDGTGSFSRITEGDIATDIATSISCVWSDFNNDGFMDLYITNGYPVRQKNQLYMNNGDGTFNKVTDDDAVNETGMYWNAVSGDYDNDGDLDIFAANYQGQNRLYNNNGLGEFTKITEGTIVNAYAVSEIGAAIWFDYNSDGFLDLFMANDINNNDVFRNEGNDNHWLELILRGTESNLSAIGARVKIKSVINGMPIWQMRDVTSIVGFRSANQVQHFGLGGATAIDSLFILWPSGQVTIRTDIPCDQILNVTEEIRPGFLRASFRADTFSGDQTLTVHFIDTSAAHSDEPVTEWAWDFNNDGLIDSEVKNPTWTYTSEIPSLYTVSLTVVNSSDTSTTSRKNYIRLKGKPVGMFSIPFYNSVSAYPNPFLDKTDIQFSLTTADLVKILVYNSYGTEIAVLTNRYESPGIKTIQWDGSDNNGIRVPKGSYFISIQGSTISQTLAIVKM